VIELTSLHWVFSIFILLIIVTMIMRRDTSLVCIIGIFLMGYMAKGTLNQAIIGIFNSFVYAINELSGTILVISLIVAMSKVLLYTGINEVMVEPFARVIRTPGIISLVGSLAKLFSVSIGSGIATLTALGQIAAIFTGGGTLIPWSVIAAAAICNVSPFELARRNLMPVLIGLFVTTVVAIFLI
jgi:hypothetical protein